MDCSVPMGSLVLPIKRFVFQLHAATGFSIQVKLATMAILLAETAVERIVNPSRSAETASLIRRPAPSPKSAMMATPTITMAAVRTAHPMNCAATQLSMPILAKPVTMATPLAGMAATRPVCLTNAAVMALSIALSVRYAMTGTTSTMMVAAPTARPDRSAVTTCSIRARVAIPQEKPQHVMPIALIPYVAIHMSTTVQERSATMVVNRRHVTPIAQ